MASKRKQIDGDKIPCFCPVCNGEKKNKKTVKRHLENFLNSHGHNSNDETTEPDSIVYQAEASFVGGQPNLSHSMLQSGNPSILRSDISSGGVSESDNDSDMDDMSHLEPLECDSQPTSDVDDIDSEDPDVDEPVDVGDDKIRDFVLRTLLSKVNFGWSQEETMAQIRNFYEVLHDERIPHNSWQSVIGFLKKLGYQDPRHYKICCAEDHVQLLDYETPCPECDKDWSSCTDYYVLGIHLEDIFLDPVTTNAHLAHWRELEEWFGGKQDDVNFKEIWHGQRFSDLSFFWDTKSETILPTSCQNCGNILTTEEICNAALPGSSSKDAVCSVGVSIKDTF